MVQFINYIEGVDKEEDEKEKVEEKNKGCYDEKYDDDDESAVSR